jgi:hypothetical protein
MAYIAVFLLFHAGGAIDGAAAHDPFRLDGAKNIVADRHFGIVNGMATIGVAHSDVAAVDGLWAPPYASADFRLTATVMGQQVATTRYVWRPFQVERAGLCNGLRVTTLVTLAPERRGGLLRLAVENSTDGRLDVPLVIATKGTLDRVRQWQFSTPVSRTPTKATVVGQTLVQAAGDAAIALELCGGGLRWDEGDRSARGSCVLPPHGRAAVYVAWAVGPGGEATAAAHAMAANPEAAIAAAEEAYQRRVGDLYEKLPRLTSSNPALVRFYDRSLVHLLMNRWEVPEFVLRPYYSTGSVKGGCVCNYLWNFGENWEILPLADPGAARRHIVQFLKTDMFHHFAFDPIAGEAFGPWYPVNQEKVVGLVYYYVLNTGDAAFLGESVAGKTVLDHVIAHATYGDDPARPVALIDYGPANNHLELRRGYPYNHQMPDLNGRRYASYLLAARLAELAGRPAPQLVERAEALKGLLKRTLWNGEARWFDFQDPQGRRDTRYTVQIFKLLASGVLDAEQEAGLLGHLNEREFFSAFGLHSMSKLDPAYDQVDIDNGGGGCCTGFPPQIAERLYRAGHARQAEEILSRILWWGERLPYWGDSLVANQVDYRKDTPLQCTVDGAAAAQCVIFGMFGVRAEFDGRIRICPNAPGFAPRIALAGLKLRGVTLDIEVNGQQYQVRTGTEVIRAKTGQEVIVDRTATHRPAVSLYP